MIRIRDALLQDVPELLRLMRALAQAEQYIDDFRVTAEELAVRGFGRRPEFFAKLATDAQRDQVIGIAVYYYLPFTYDLRPTLVLKELYVEEPYRSRGTGRKLLLELAQAARRRGCGRMRWDVFQGNIGAEKFYQRLGGRHEDQWIAYRLDGPGIDKLADAAAAPGQEIQR